MIFNKNNSGTVEFRRSIGFLYKSVTFEKFVPFIDIVSSNLIDIVGRDVFKLAEDHYKSDDFEQEGFDALNTLVYKVQDCISRGSFKLFAPSGDITHGDKGRQIYVSDTEKPAFEWQINKDDENLANLEGFAIDGLLAFLDEQAAIVVEEGEESDVSIGETWKNTEVYRVAHRMLINNAKDFGFGFDIKNSRRLFMMLLPFMAQAEAYDILPRIGADKFNSLKEMILSGGIEGEDYVGLYTKIKSCLPLLTVSRACIPLSAELLPEGLFVNFVTNTQQSKQALNASDRTQLSKKLKEMGEQILLDIENDIRIMNGVVVEEPTRESVIDKFKNKFFNAI